jgi:hypothetical protein
MIDSDPIRAIPCKVITVAGCTNSTVMFIMFLLAIPHFAHYYFFENIILWLTNVHIYL